MNLVRRPPFLCIEFSVCNICCNMKMPKALLSKPSLELHLHFFFPFHFVDSESDDDTMPFMSSNFNREQTNTEEGRMPQRQSKAVFSLAICQGKLLANIPIEVSHCRHEGSYVVVGLIARTALIWCRVLPCCTLENCLCRWSEDYTYNYVPTDILTY